MATPALNALEPELAAVPGTVSVWCGRPGRPATYARLPHAPHYAASTMKVAVMAAAYRLAEAGRLDLDATVPIHDDFASVSGAGPFWVTRDYDNDDEVWLRAGHHSGASLRWLIRRMIVASGNLATNLVLERIGLDAVATVWSDAGARHSVVTRGIQDQAGEDSGFSNVVTAADLAALFGAIATGAIAGPDACREMLDVLLAQEITIDVVAGLPPRTRVAHKNGWVEGVRHSAALILPEDAPPYVLVVCVSADQDDAANCAVVRRIAAASWADRRLSVSRCGS